GPHRLHDCAAIDHGVWAVTDPRPAPAGTFLAHAVSLGSRPRGDPARLADLGQRLADDARCAAAEILVADVGRVVGDFAIWPVHNTLTPGQPVARRPAGADLPPGRVRQDHRRGGMPYWILRGGVHGRAPGARPC